MINYKSIKTAGKKISEKANSLYATAFCLTASLFIPSESSAYAYLFGSSDQIGSSNGWSLEKSLKVSSAAAEMIIPSESLQLERGIVFGPGKIETIIPHSVSQHLGINSPEESYLPYIIGAAVIGAGLVLGGMIKDAFYSTDMDSQINDFNKSDKSLQIDDKFSFSKNLQKISSIEKEVKQKTSSLEKEVQPTNTLNSKCPNCFGPYENPLVQSNCGYCGTFNDQAENFK